MKSSKKIESPKDCPDRMFNETCKQDQDILCDNRETFPDICPLKASLKSVKKAKKVKAS